MFKRIFLYLTLTFGAVGGIYFVDQQTPEPIPPTPLPTGQYMTAPAKISRLDAETWVLDEDFIFIDSLGNEWVAPAGTKTDGASIPQAFLSLVGDKFNPQFLDAAVVHDAYCDSNNFDGASYQTETWEYVHYMFYEALLTSGVPEEKAKVMFTAVYMGGPRWEGVADPNNPSSRSLLFEREVTDEMVSEFESMVDWIEEENPSPEAILQALETE